MITNFVMKRLSGKLAKKFSKKTLSAAQKRALAKAVKASALARRKSAVKTLSTRQAKRLAKLNTRIKANQQALRAISGKDTVFRLQNKRGQGPLMKRVVPPKRIASLADSARKPFPVQRHQNIEALRKSMPDAHFEYLDFKRGEYFGFKTPKQAEKWFNKQELDWYKRKGYNLTKVQGVTIQAKSNNQLTFTKHKDYEKIQKETAKLLAKYKKLSK